MINKNILLIAVLPLLISCSQTRKTGSDYESQMVEKEYFSGKIVYSYQFLDPKTGKDITEEMSKEFGKEQHYYTDGKNYKSFDETGKLGQLYVGSTNKYYFPNPQTGELMVIDASFDMSNNYEVMQTKEREKILDFPTKKVIVSNNNSKTTYWYAEELKVDTENFKDHNFGGWNKFLEASKGSLALKFVVENEGYIWITEAKEVKAKSFEQNYFTLQALMD